MHYIAEGDPTNPNAVINPDLVNEIEFFRYGDKSKFAERLDRGFNNLQNFAKASKMESRYKKMGFTTSNLRDFNKVLEAFYYNWVTFSTEFKKLQVGSEFQFKNYNDEVKRSKMLISPATRYILRNSSWTYDGTELSLEEGKKLPANLKVAYVSDIVIPLTSNAGEYNNQEIYDGVTFVSPLTRMQQQASNGGQYGINTPTIAKNVTYANDIETGITGYVKDTEFLITVEDLKTGQDRARNMMTKMLDQRFKIPVEENGKVYRSALDVLQDIMEEEIGSPMTYQNVSYENFSSLLDWLVAHNLQDIPIHQVVVSTAIKTGGQTFNQLDSEINPNGDSWVPSSLDMRHKGQQQDTSKDPTVEANMQSTSPSQLWNAAGINWKNEAVITELYTRLGTYAKTIAAKYNGWRSDRDVLEENLRAIVTKSILDRDGISYAHDAVLKGNFSLNDRQLLATLIPVLNSEIAKKAVGPDFFGGQYVVHPSWGIKEDLKWADPVYKDGTTFQDHQLFKDYYAAMQSQNPELIQQTRKLLQASLESGDWTPGEAEILLPQIMREAFGLREGQTVEFLLSEEGYQHFLDQVEQKYPKWEDAEKRERADRMRNDFEKQLQGIMIRIPTTGKHSAVATRIKGFMNESSNSVAVPPMLLFIQGADQDYDKGTYLTFQTIDGIIPMTEKDLADLLKGYSGKKLESRRELIEEVILKNNIVQLMRDIISDPANTIESNISVAGILNELKGIIANDSRFQKPGFNRYDYLSLAEMHRINQSGKNLTAIFANAQKAYQVLYTTGKLQPGSVNLAGLEDDFNTVWMKFSGLVNAAVDNAKEQILGTIGINENNANMVSYMVASGMSFNEIVDFLNDPKNKADLQKLEDSKKFFSRKAFKPETEWKNNPDLVKIYRRGEEMGMLAMSLINTTNSFPNSAYDMHAFEQRLNKFINKTFAKVKGKPFFNLQTFLSASKGSDTRTKAIADYDAAIGDGTGNNSFNILRVIDTVPHIQGYFDAWLVSRSIVNESSSVVRAADSISAEVAKDKDFPVSRDQYREITDFVYGLVVDGYFKSNRPVKGKHDLGKAQGRADFVKAFNDSIDVLKGKYKNNPFIQSLTVEEVERYGWGSAKQLRTVDLRTLSEERFLEYREGYNSLPDTLKQKFVDYNLIVYRANTGRGSWASLFRASDMNAYNNYMDSLTNIIGGENKTDIYEAYKAYSENNKQLSSQFPHNIIPVTNLPEMQSDLNPVQFTEGMLSANDARTALKILNEEGITLGSEGAFSVIALENILESKADRKYIIDHRTENYRMLKDIHDKYIANRKESEQETDKMKEVCGYSSVTGANTVLKYNTRR